MKTAVHSDSSVQVNTYARPPLTFSRGEGVWLFDTSGKRFLDFGSGIAVTALGHSHPVLVETLAKQAEALWHASNLFHTRPAEELARRLVAHSFADSVFLCNSGTEATEAALKFACLYHLKNGRSGRTRLVSFARGFHGRSCGSLAVTANKNYREPYSALVAHETDFAPFNVQDGLAERINEKTLAVIVEPIQGEGGVHPATHGFLAELSRLCEATSTPLIFDEVQCGLGRTGRFLAHEIYTTFDGGPLVPDLVTLAKPLANGLPCGAVLARERIAACVAPGDHGSTFGGNPLACAVACSVVDMMLETAFLENVRELGFHFEETLGSLRERFPNIITGLRGRGLMWGMDLALDAPVVLESAREAGLIVLSAGPKTLRLLPPLIIDKSHIELFAERMSWVLSKT